MSLPDMLPVELQPDLSITDSLILRMHAQSTLIRKSCS